MTPGRCLSPLSSGFLLWDSRRTAGKGGTWEREGHLSVCLFAYNYFLFKICILCWSVVDLQCYISFRYITTFFHYTDTYNHSFSDFFPIQIITEYWIEFPVLYSTSLLIIYFTYSSVYTGEGNGTPLQHSCLENPMDGGAWWAEVHGVTKSWTRLSDFTFTFSLSCIGEGATHSSVLAWRIPGAREPGGLTSMGSHRVGHDWTDLAAAAVCIC